MIGKEGPTMKRILSLLLCAMLVYAVAAAETAGPEAPVLAYEVSVTVPEGYTSDGLIVLDTYKCCQQFLPEDEKKPRLVTIISYNESFADTTFNDQMPEEEFQACVSLIARDEETGEVLPYTVQKTGLGTKIIVFSAEAGATEYYTIWHGYEVSLYAYNGTEDEALPVTKAQDKTIMQFLTDLDLSAVIDELD